MADAEEILNKYWGYNQFRPLQKEIIQTVLSGNDALALMPTGGGKSICFQVPAMAKEGLCLVVSPLIALMKDQVSHLKKKGIPALSINSGMNFIEVKKTLQNAAYGNFKFLYVSPERLESSLFLEYLPVINIQLIAVDEAHCISQWGYDFRPPYLRIAALREYFPVVPILALTASATPEVQKDICEKLCFKPNFQTYQQSFERPNLSYSAFELSSPQNKLIGILQKVPGSSIVYCKTRKRTKEVAQLLNINKIDAGFYHAGLTNEQRTCKQEEWIKNKTRVICCTNAFGMGIDKPDVRTVIHYDVPDALENYYQEAGRAGRDGMKSYAILFYNSKELSDLKKQISTRFPSVEMIRNVYGSLCNHFQLPSGNGEGLSYDFDINSFVNNFNLDAFTVNSVLKILEQEELITYSSQFFSPVKVVFTADKPALEIFEKSYPQHQETIKGLLRSYEGILDFPAIINEYKLSKFIGIPKEDLSKALKEISQMGIIDFSPQKEKPQIFFLQNRVKASELTINVKNLSKRKQAYVKRLHAMIQFADNKSRCRSAMIGTYFNAPQLKRCGICDNCLLDKKTVISKEDFMSISREIKNAVNKEFIGLPLLLIKLKSFQKNKVIKVLHFLQEENTVMINEEGFIKLA